MTHTEKPDPSGVYVIRCTKNDAFYVGSAVKLERRLRSHVSKLNRGDHDVRLLQEDWQRYGPDAFQFRFTPAPLQSCGHWEEALIHLTRSLEHCSGYNRMIGRRFWAISAQIRDSERKLWRKHRFIYLPTIHPDSRLEAPYLESFTRNGETTPLFERESANLKPFQVGDELRDMLLTGILNEFMDWSPHYEKAAASVDNDVVSDFGKHARRSRILPKTGRKS